MRSKPEHGPALMSYVWGGVTAARQNMMRQYEASSLCFLMFVATILLSILGIYVHSAAVNAIAAIVVALVMLIGFSVVLRPVIAKFNAFCLIQTSLHFSISGASFYFFTDSPEAYPEGPHVSKEFYTSVLGVIGAICSLVGIWSYQKYATAWSYQRLFITTNLVLGALSMLDVVFYSRLNLRAGIPDKMFVIGTEAFEDVIFTWMWMPGVVLLSHLCPEGMEATMFALLAGCHNLGGTIAASCGALVLQVLGCQPSGEPGESAQFENLWLAALLSIILPLCTALLVPWLIPDAKQTDKLIPDGDRDATKGSLLRRWQGREDA